MSRQLWRHEFLKYGSSNPADIETKHVSRDMLARHLERLGCHLVQSVGNPHRVAVEGVSGCAAHFHDNTLIVFACVRTAGNMCVAEPKVLEGVGAKENCASQRVHTCMRVCVQVYRSVQHVSSMDEFYWWEGKLVLPMCVGHMPGRVEWVNLGVQVTPREKLCGNA